MNTLVQCLESPLATLNLTGDPASSNLALVPRTSPGAELPAPLPAFSPPVVTVSPPILKGRPRTGAIASLPKDERDMACRMIANGVPYKRIAEALDQLGFEVTERNISNWVTHGGYAEWCTLYDDALQTTLRQDDLLQHHRSENSPDLAEVGLQSAAVRISELLLRQAASNQDVEANFSKLEPVVNLLCRINKELFNLQKYRDDCLTKIFRPPARTKAKDREKLLLHEMIYSAEPKPKLPDAPAPGANGSPTTPPAATAQPPASSMPAATQSTSAHAAVHDAPPAGQPPPAAASSSETAAAPPTDAPPLAAAAQSHPPK